MALRIREVYKKNILYFSLETCIYYGRLLELSYYCVDSPNGKLCFRSSESAFTSKGSIQVFMFSCNLSIKHLDYANIGTHLNQPILLAHLSYAQDELL